MYTIADEIRLNEQASRLDELASKYESVIFDVRTGKKSLADWDSPAADQWRSKMDSVISGASASVSDLRSTAGRIRSFTAAHHYLLEEELEKLAEIFT